MYIALAKRRENIAEYILYLWQMEDMMRALRFSPEAIYARLVQPRGLDAEQENSLMVWYMGVADLLREEGKAESGHMTHTLHLIADLQRLHEQLMTLPAREKYRALYARLEPELPALRTITGKDGIGDIELAFRALYAVMLYRMKGEETGGKAAADVLELVSPVIAGLAGIFRQVETGDLDLFKEE